MANFNDYYNIYNRTVKTENPLVIVEQSSNVNLTKKQIVSNKALFKSEKAAQNKKCVVVIPVYRKPNTFEMVNLLKTVSVFKHTHTIVLICPDNIPVNEYNIIYGYEFSVARFPRHYFRSKETYSELLLSVGFY